MGEKGQRDYGVRDGASISGEVQFHYLYQTKIKTYSPRENATSRSGSGCGMTDSRFTGKSRFRAGTPALVERLLGGQHFTGKKRLHGGRWRRWW
jgi:hypothetical protein